MSNAFDIANIKKRKNYIIDASAGTGKTYSIVEIVCKLISEGIPLGEMLVVTYTDKAAGELKSRIREKVSKDNDVDSASIGTIHSFCKNSIKEFCVASGKPSDLSLIDENEVKGFVKRYIRDSTIFDQVSELKQIFLDNGLSYNAEDSIEKMICAIMDKYYLNKDYVEDKSIVSILRTTGYEEIKEVVFDKIRQFDKSKVNWKDNHDIERCLEIFKKSTSKTLNDLSDKIQNSEKIPSVSSALKLKKITEEERDALSTIEAIKEESKFQINILNGAKADFKQCLQCIVLDNIENIYKAWQEEKHKLSQQTFNDMLRNVREDIVNNGPLLSELRNKYKYAIIDEFQDTNKKQWDIFKGIFLCEGHNIIVVGDPKQSIYSFQGADLNAYENAKKDILDGGGEQLTLAKNYRSTKDMVEGFAAEFFSNPTAIETFEKSECGKDNLKVEYDCNPVEPVWINIKEDEYSDIKEYATLVCQTIVDCCQYIDETHTKLQLYNEYGEPRNVSFNDFAILARTRSEMEPVKRALENSGIPYLENRESALFDSLECAHWISLLEAIDAPDFSGKNRLKLKKALYTVFFGHSLSEVNSDKYDKDNLDEILLFDNWRELVKNKSWESLIDRIMSDTDVETRLCQLKNLKSVGIIRQLGDYCVEKLSSGYNLNSLIKNLKARLEGYDDDSEQNDNIIAKATDFDAVKMMTIHASKGLQFPIVISVSGFKDLKPWSEIYDYHNEEGDYVLSFQNPDNDEKIAEFQRLYYVAYTRPEYILVLPHYKQSDKSKIGFISLSIEEYSQNYKYKPINIDKTISYEDLRKSVKEILRKNSVNVMHGSVEDEEEQIKNLKEFIKNKFYHSSFKHAYSSLSHSSSDAEIISESAIILEHEVKTLDENLSKYDPLPKIVKCAYNSKIDPKTYVDDYPAGADLGNALHEIFETIDYSTEMEAKDIELLIKTCFKKYGITTKPEWIECTKIMIDNVLNAKFPVIHGNAVLYDESFKLNHIDLNSRRNEVEFNFSKDEKLRHYFNGFIDLIIKQGDYYSILDWKSDKLNDDFTAFNDINPLKTHVDKLYAIQRVLYSYTLIKWLKGFYNDLSEEDIFTKHFGGVYYVFLRGCNTDTGNGVYAQTWECYKDLEEAYKLILKDKVRG